MANPLSALKDGLDGKVTDDDRAVGSKISQVAAGVSGAVAQIRDRTHGNQGPVNTHGNIEANLKQQQSQAEQHFNRVENDHPGITSPGASAFLDGR